MECNTNKTITIPKNMFSFFTREKNVLFPWQWSAFPTVKRNWQRNCE